MNRPSIGFAPMYGVELLLDSPPSLSLEELLEAIQTHCPAAEPLDRSGKGNVLAFVHTDHPVACQSETPFAQTFICPADRPFEVDDAVSNDLGQSWSFPGVAEVVGRCRSRLLVTDMLASLLEPKQRLELFLAALAGVLEVVPALAVHWQPTGQFIDPSRFLDAYEEGGATRFFAGSLNVRFYQISNAPGDMIMDTLGLTALGLPDLQCHFRGLEPGRVAAVLHDTAYYLYERGDIIGDGHTVEGATTGRRWRCQHERSILPPSRAVLDLDPGPPYAAGVRQGTS